MSLLGARNGATRWCILIDDIPTAKVDFDSIHVQILSAEKAWQGQAILMNCQTDRCPGRFLPGKDVGQETPAHRTERQRQAR